MDVSVILPTHNPHAGRLARTLAGLAAQTLDRERWELVIIDNASTSPLALPAPPLALRIIREPAPGLTAARRAGLRAAQGDLVVFVDDDNILAPSYLADVVRHFTADPTLGAAGGPSRPEFETPPPAWAEEFFPLLALRDLGAQPILASFSPARVWPDCAPIGAGMALRATAARVWLDTPSPVWLTDRRGQTLTSGGDNDIAATLLAAGWRVGYFPELALTHLIPAGRLDAHYLARLNRGIQHSWQQVLRHHRLSSWGPLTSRGARLRKFKAWFTHRAWSSPAARIRWQGACGHFDGRVSSSS